MENDAIPVCNRFRKWIECSTYVKKVQRVVKGAGLAYSRFREWIGHWTCVRQVQRVDRTLDLCVAGSES